MQSYTELWSMIEPVVIAEGLELYDIERSAGLKGKGGVIKVYLSRGLLKAASENEDADSVEEDAVGQSESGVNISQCAKVSRKISALSRFEDTLPENTTLEVSRAGINRKLRRDEHFATAVGEHIWIKGCHEQGSKDAVYKGVLTDFSDEAIRVKEDKKGSDLLFPLSNIVSARIDFIFS